MAVINSNTERAIQVLLKETFSHTRKNMNLAYADLAIENSKLKNITSNHFCSNGIVYPSINSAIRVPSLHYSLLPKLEIIKDMINIAGYHQIKNYFAAVFNNIYNEQSLKELLPDIAINRLKNRFSPGEFQLIAQGQIGCYNYIAPSDVIQNIEELKIHYASTIISLREILMEQLLTE